MAMHHVGLFYMKPRLKKIVCPKDHQVFDRGTGKKKNIEKLLLIYHEEDNDTPRNFWIHCGIRGCEWFNVRFKKDGGVMIKELDKSAKFKAQRAACIYVSKDESDGGAKDPDSAVSPS